MPLRWERAVRKQLKTLHRLLTVSARTRFGKHYAFDRLLRSEQQVLPEVFKKAVPVHTYESIYDKWWWRVLEGEPDVTWRGKPMYFALSSGTTAGSTKYIPISKEMYLSFRNINMQILLTVISRYRMSPGFFVGKCLTLGGKPPVKDSSLSAPAGDLSGIMNSRVPVWFKRWMALPDHVRNLGDWQAKIEYIVLNASKWNITAVIGLPQWTIKLFRQIMERYQLETIHQMWRNFALFIYGGLPLEPYRQEWNKLVAKPVKILETYLASEGYIAFQDSPEHSGLRLTYDAGIYYEFIPFSEENFDESGNLKEKHESYSLYELAQLSSDYVYNTSFAVVLSTCAGAWRYLLGDIIRFVVDERVPRLRWAGRIKYFLNICGEHLSMENMGSAFLRLREVVSEVKGDFTVVPAKKGNVFYHIWFISTATNVQVERLAKIIDVHLQAINDDYATVRRNGLLELSVVATPESKFYEWLERHGKVGGQHKFPAVLRGERAISWLTLVDKNLLDQFEVI